jgi:tRNA threonylcarbamoyladenosine biosynthesis protein TsaB
MAWNLRATDKLLCPVLKSRVGEVYWAQYRWADAGVMERPAPEQVGTIEALAQTLTGPTVVFGEGWQANRDELRCLLGPRAQYACEPPLEKMAASAVSVGLAGQELLARGLLVGTGLAPRYVQRAEAEIHWERRCL